MKIKKGSAEDKKKPFIAARNHLSCVYGPPKDRSMRLETIDASSVKITKKPPSKP